MTTALFSFLVPCSSDLFMEGLWSQLPGFVQNCTILEIQGEDSTTTTCPQKKRSMILETQSFIQYLPSIPQIILDILTKQQEDSWFDFETRTIDWVVTPYPDNQFYKVKGRTHIQQENELKNESLITIQLDIFMNKDNIYQSRLGSFVIALLERQIPGIIQRHLKKLYMGFAKFLTNQT